MNSLLSIKKLIAGFIKPYVKFLYSSKENLVLDFASGSCPAKGCISVDLSKTAKIYLDLESFPLPFCEGSVAHIYCSHFIEHLDYKNFEKFMAEIWRILKPGGTIRLVAPDFDKFLIFHLESDLSQPYDSTLINVNHPLGVLEYICYNRGHRSLHNKRSLTLVCQALDFEIEESSYDSSIDPADRSWESFYFNLIKRERKI